MVIALALPLLVQAQEADVSIVNIDFRPEGGNVVENYLNRTNGGFVASAFLENYESIEKVELLLDGSPFNPAIERTMINGTVVFLSGTLNNDALRLRVPEGGRFLSLKTTTYPKDGSVTQEVGRQRIVADYTLPEGTLAYDTEVSSSTASGWLKIGDQVNFHLTLTAPDITATTQLPTGLFNGRSISWVGSADPGVFLGSYQVAEGDSDRTAPIPVTGVEISDLAGNITEVAPISVTEKIDANSPEVSVSSPEAGATYSSKEVPFEHGANEPLSKLSFVLDGVPVPDGATSLKDLSDGSHILTIEATDQAGNRKTSTVSFSVDTTVPPVNVPTNPDGGNVEQGSTIIFEGETEPNAKVKIEVFSDPQTSETTAGADGKFRIEFNTSNLDSGTHEAYITVTDAAGNSQRLKISTFEIFKNQPVILAQTSENESGARTDVTPRVISSNSQNQAAAQSQAVETPQPTQVANAGSTLSTSTTRQQKTNWGAWLTLFGIVILAAAIATAGYYGYEWATAEEDLSEQDLSPPNIKKEELPEEIQTIVDARAVEESLINKKPTVSSELSETKESGSLDREESTPETRW